jgi:hypothetical protein
LFYLSLYLRRNSYNLLGSLFVKRSEKSGRKKKFGGNAYVPVPIGLKSFVLGGLIEKPSIIGVKAFSENSFSKALLNKGTPNKAFSINHCFKPIPKCP